MILIKSYTFPEGNECVERRKKSHAVSERAKGSHGFLYGSARYLTKIKAMCHLPQVSSFFNLAAEDKRKTETDATARLFVIAGDYRRAREAGQQ